MKTFWVAFHFTMMAVYGFLLIWAGMQEASLESIQRMLGFLAVMIMNLGAVAIWLAPRSRD